MITHWLKFNPTPENITRARRAISEGSGFALVRVYPCHRDLNFYFLEVESADSYEALRLDVNSGSSPFSRVLRRPPGLSRGLTVEAFEGIFGPLGRPQSIEQNREADGFRDRQPRRPRGLSR